MKITGRVSRFSRHHSSEDESIRRYSIELNEIVYENLEMALKEAVVAYFKTQPQNLPRETLQHYKQKLG
jgi:hypothetical protein